MTAPDSASITFAEVGAERLAGTFIDVPCELVTMPMVSAIGPGYRHHLRVERLRAIAGALTVAGAVALQLANLLERISDARTAISTRVT